MLKPVRSKAYQAGVASFAIVASRYNGLYVEAMLRAATNELKRAGVRQIKTIRVPGAYEIPIVVARLALRRHPPDSGGKPPAFAPAAIICLGVILRGETVHAAHIGENVSRALMEIQLRELIPVVHEVLLLENEDQARVRCLGRKHNRGTEAAQTALAMAKVLRGLGA